MVRRTLSAVAAAPFMGAILWAQDTRTVREPVVPAACATLDAVLVPVGDSTVSDADESKVDSPRIQQAIDGCAAGRAVVLRAAGNRRAFVSGPLQLRTGVTLVLDRGVVLYASRNASLFDITPNACGRLRAEGGRGCRALITAERANGSAVMGPGVIDGRGWATLVGRNETWWEMAEQARDTKYSQNNPRLIQTQRSNDFTLYNLTLRNSPNFHVVVERADGFTAWGVTINTPKGARNTDGIDPSGSSNVSILHSYIHTGDDNIAIKAGSTGAARNITVAHSHFYNGHGVSVGSETDGGAGNILVRDVTFQGTDNALRIKSNASRGGVVQGVTYENACIRDVRYPIYMDSHYSASPEQDGNKIPHFTGVVVRDVRIMGRGTVVLDGYDAARTLDITFDGVYADEPARIASRGQHAQLTIGAHGSSVVIPDSVARVTGARKPGAMPATLGACSSRLTPFPGGAATPITVRKLAPPTDGGSSASGSAAERATYRNPILPADFSDPDVIRDGEDFWMTASSFSHVPGLPILHSRDLVHWSLVNHALPKLYDAAFDTPQHGNGVWAPTLRMHDGWYWIFYGDPDRGIYMTRTRDPRGSWSAPHLVQAGKGLIDPSPLWTADGKAWLVHAYARSRSGIKHRLVVHEMKPDGSALLDTGTLVFEDSVRHPTMEGPKFYQRGNETWILAPAGGVATGWQVALRALHPRGPYRARTVLAQQNTTVNGPHQGAWVALESGEDWFLHFQDRGAYGRIVHLQPMTWRADGWPVIGEATAADTTGRPVLVSSVPLVTAGAASAGLQMTDEFDTGNPGIQWQWQANPQSSWKRSTTDGVLALVAHPLAAPARNLWDAPNLLLQKFAADSFTVTTQLSVRDGAVGDRAGLMVFGLDYAWIGLERRADGWQLVASQVKDADKGTADTPKVLAAMPIGALQLRLRVATGGIVRFSWRVGDGAFADVAESFTAREGKWVGAKFGVFASSVSSTSGTPAEARFNFVRVVQR
ncbi:MAG: family 43 glycosylhydrolase [Gemmatimonadaceae bacterium]|nr:family 43 glycosylhydrolase [Gemmatimonadaceae bacterium]